MYLEEFRSKLAGQKRDVLDNGQPNSPVLVLSEVLDGRQEALG